MKKPQIRYMVFYDDYEKPFFSLKTDLETATKLKSQNKGSEVIIRIYSEKEFDELELVW